MTLLHTKEARYTTYLQSTTGELWCLDLIEAKDPRGKVTLRCPYDTKKPLIIHPVSLARAVKLNILKPIWSTTKEGEYV